VCSDPRNVTRIASAGLKIGLVPVEGLGDGRRSSVLSATIAAGARDDASVILCLPEVENCLAISLIEVIGGTNRLGPVAALTVGGPNHPCPGRRVTTVSQTDSWADFCENGLLGHR
jgi:hypothetical protein